MALNKILGPFKFSATPTLLVSLGTCIQKAKDKQPHKIKESSKKPKTLNNTCTHACMHIITNMCTALYMHAFTTHNVHVTNQSLDHVIQGRASKSKQL